MYGGFNQNIKILNPYEKNKKKAKPTQKQIFEQKKVKNVKKNKKKK